MPSAHARRSMSCEAGRLASLTALRPVAAALRARNPDVTIALADPPGAALYSYYTTGELKAEGSSITEGIGQGRITARELATQLEVSERTIYRDMEALSMAGIPVMAERGINGGWELLEGYRANLNALNLTEIQSIFLAAPASILNDLGLQNAAENAVLKLLAALPNDYRADAEAMRITKALVDPWQA